MSLELLLHEVLTGQCTGVRKYNYIFNKTLYHQSKQQKMGLVITAV